MDWTQMKERCPSARFICVAMLPDHRLAFTRKSVNRGCGVADVVRNVGNKVWGVVYDISDVHVGQLDKSEGYRSGREKNSYWRRECIVFVDGDDGQPLNAATYFGDPEPNVPLPNQEYKDLILAGARHWHLPADYASDLDRIEVAA
jgi:gamma-glutamylcyclotransferase (GGCT)/AIG2-like uncharacterized protein YtfP